MKEIKNRKYNQEKVAALFKERGCELLDIYQLPRIPMKYRCVCGKENVMNLNNFLKGKNCKECGINKRVKTVRIESYEHLKNVCTDKGYSILTSLDEFLNFPYNMKTTHQIIKIKCAKNHIMDRSYSYLLNRNGECRECFLEHNRGANHHWWIDGRTPEYRLSRTNYREFEKKWKKDVYRRDLWKCQLSGSNYKIRAHHLNGYNWDIENRWNPDNGVTLCLGHHKIFHCLYGSGQNTKEQFLEYSKFIFELKELNLNIVEFFQYLIYASNNPQEY